MKIFAFIMAFIVLVLSCVPCGDGAYAMRGKAKIESFAKHQSGQSHTESDSCSPFCTCNCCAGFAFLLFSIKLQPVAYAPSKTYSSYLSSSAIAVSLPIWQPPQL